MSVTLSDRKGSCRPSNESEILRCAHNDTVAPMVLLEGLSCNFVYLITTSAPVAADS